MVKITDVWMKVLLNYAWNISDHYHFDVVLYKDPGCPLCLLIASSWEQITSFSSLSELLAVCTKGKCLYFQCWNQFIKVIQICKVKDSAFEENFKVLNIACDVCVCIYEYTCVCDIICILLAVLQWQWWRNSFSRCCRMCSWVKDYRASVSTQPFKCSPSWKNPRAKNMHYDSHFSPLYICISTA